MKNRDCRKYEEIACTSKEECEKIKAHLRLAFCEAELSIRIIYAYANKYRLFVSLNKFEFMLLDKYLSNCNLGNVRRWNY